MPKNKKIKLKPPVTVQDTIPITAVHFKENIIETEPGVFTKSYKLQDTNYQTANEEDQETMFLKYCDLLNSFDNKCRVSITINNKNINQDDFERNVLIKEIGDDKDTLRMNFNEMLFEKISEGKNNIIKDKYITISVEADDIKKAVHSFITLETAVKDNIKAITKLKEDIDCLSIEERLEILHDIYNVGHEGEFSSKTKIDGKEVSSFNDTFAKQMGLSVKDLIAPSSFSFKKPSFFLMGNKYCRALSIVKYPTSVQDDFISELTNTDFNMLTSINIEPVQQDKALKIVNTNLININANVQEAEKKATKNGYSPESISYDLKRRQAEATDLMAELTSKNQKMFFLNISCLIIADSLEELNTYTESVRSICRKYLFRLQTLTLQQEDGLNACLPLCINKLKHKRTLTTNSVAVFMPFNALELSERSGMYYSLNAITKNMIIYDRKKGSNYNGWILGTPGCLDRDTEFFNGKEWKSIADYKEGEMVLQFDTDTNEASLVKPLAYIKKPCDKMYHFETKYGIDQTLSEEHRVLYYDRNTHKKGTYSKVKEISGKELFELQNSGKFRGKFKTDFEYNGPGIDLSDNEIKLMLAVICDGSFNKNNPESLRCRLNLKKDRKKVAIEKLFKEAGIEYASHNTDKGYTEYSFYSPKREKHFLPYWYNCNKEQLKLISENILQWDGHEDNQGRKSFSTVVKETADFVQFVFSACGYRATISEVDRVGQIKATNNKEYERKSIEYNVVISNNTMVGMEHHNDGRATNPMVTEVTPVDGYKYCFTVPTHALVLRRNGKIFITGNSGKSFTAKREMLSVFLSRNADVIVIDPEAEYYPLAKILGGEVIKITPGGEFHINPFDMDEAYGADEVEPIIAKTDFIVSLCNIVAGGMFGLSAVQKSIIERCVRRVYRPFVEHDLDQEYLPTLVDFQKELLAQRDPEAREIAVAFEQFTDGSFNTFAYKTNVKTNSRFIVYDIKNIGTNIRGMAMSIILDSIWNRICINRKTGRETWFYIDEAHLLLKEEDTAKFLRDVYKRARKYNGIPTSMTQNVSDILSNEIAKTMLSNSNFIQMLNQAPLDRADLSTLLNISQYNQGFITSAGPGQGLIYTGSTIIPFKDTFPQDNPLYKVLTSNPEEIQKFKEEEARRLAKEAKIGK